MKTVIHLKTDKDVKEKAQKIARELGVPLSTVINSQLKQFIRNKSLYLSAVPRMTPHLEKIVAKAKKDYRLGKNISPSLRSAQAMDEYLDDE